MAADLCSYSPRRLAILGSSLTILLTVSACRSHSGASEAAGQNAHSAQQQTHVESEAEKSCREFVQGFYDWYINDHLKDDKVSAWFDVPRQKPQILSGQLLRLLNRESAEQERTHEIGAIDFDPFLNSQDPSETYVVRRVSVVGEKCDVLVKGSTEVRPELTRRPSDWVFANFHYSYFTEDAKTRLFPDGDLVHMLVLEEELEKAEKKKSAQK